MFKKILAVIAISAISVNITGCLSFSKELSERLIVSVMGVDFDGENYCLSAACLSTAGSDSEQEGFNAEHISYESASLNEAFSGLNEKTNKSLFWGQATAVLISADAAKERLSEIISFLSNEESFRMNIHILIYNGLANETVRMKTNNNVTIGDDIEKLLSNMPKGTNCSVKLFELAATMNSGGVTAFLPILRAQENEEQLTKENEDLKTVKVSIEELLVINKNNVFGAVSLESSVWALLLQNKVKEIEASLLNIEKLNGIVLNALNTSLQLKNGLLIVEVYTTAYKNKGKATDSQVKEQLADTILKHVRDSYEYYNNELGVDILNKSALLHANGIDSSSYNSIPVVFSIKLNLIS